MQVDHVGAPASIWSKAGAILYHTDGGEGERLSPRLDKIRREWQVAEACTDRCVYNTGLGYPITSNSLIPSFIPPL